ncbi:MAG: zinc-dependent metalloprotease family protein [Candidatus Limnocylindrales bacterium]
MRKLVASSVAAAVMAVAASAPATASAEPIEVGHIPKCLEAVPAAVAIPLGAPLALDVRVLLDGVGQARGAAIMDTAKESYSRLGIALTPSFQSVSFSGTDAQGLIDQSKALYGGTRPAGIDIVYTLTSKDIQAGGNTAVAGLADCIGGVAFADRAFGVGENFTTDESLAIGPTALARNLTAKVAAHEIGHLMGGHHHYANCAEGLLADPPPDELSPCTLMINAVDLASLNFGTPNGLVVRGHMEAYAP